MTLLCQTFHKVMILFFTQVEPAALLMWPLKPFQKLCDSFNKALGLSAVLINVSGPKLHFVKR